MKKYLILSCVMLPLFLCACAHNEEIGADNLTTSLFDHVIDIGTYTELNYEYAEKKLSLLFDKWGGMCSAAAVISEDGDMLVGRNYDLIISDKPVYVYKTRVDDCYETLCFTYNHRYGSSYSSVINNGLTEDVYQVIPFMASDVLNSEGLYIEMNMRYDESDENGESKFGCSGTNEASETRVCAIAIPQLVGLNCADVDEAVEYIKDLNIYSMNGSGVNWNLCFMLADASGHYGLLEMGDDEIAWLDYQPVQTNFYVTQRLADAQLFKSGVGRYDYLMEKIPNIKNEAEFSGLMNDVRYSLIYYPEQAKYDVRSEYVGETIGQYPAITYEQITDETNADTVMEYIMESQKEIDGLSTEQSRKLGIEWESILTLMVNCNNKTVTARFFEDDAFVTVLSFE